MKETLKHKDVFNKYYLMGSNRSLSKLRNILVSPEGTQEVPSLKSLKRWSKAFNWQERIEQRDIENSKKLDKKVNDAVVNSKADYRKLIKETVDLYRDKLKEKKIIINRPQDLDTLAKLDLTLMGEATEITEQKGLEELDRKLSLLTIEELKKLSKANADK